MDLHYQKKKQALERYLDHSEGWYIQKTSHASQKDASERPLKLLQHDSKIKFKKSKMMWQDPKEALTSLKSGEPSNG